MGQRPIQFGQEVTIANAITGAGAIPVAATLIVALPGGARSTGRLRLRFTCTQNLTLGDGTLANSIAIVGQRAGGAAANVVELLGFAGIGLGGAMPQIPMLANGGATPRDFSMLIDLADGYDSIGIAAYANAQSAGAGNFSAFASWVLGGGDQPAGT